MSCTKCACPIFSKHFWRPTRCNVCFHPAAAHTGPIRHLTVSPNDAPLPTSASFSSSSPSGSVSSIPGTPASQLNQGREESQSMAEPSIAKSESTFEISNNSQRASFHDPSISASSTPHHSTTGEGSNNASEIRSLWTQREAMGIVLNRQTSLSKVAHHEKEQEKNQSSHHHDLNVSIPPTPTSISITAASSSSASVAQEKIEAVRQTNYDNKRKFKAPAKRGNDQSASNNAEPTNDATPPLGPVARSPAVSTEIRLSSPTTEEGTHAEITPPASKQSFSETHADPNTASTPTSRTSITKNQTETPDKPSSQSLSAKPNESSPIIAPVTASSQPPSITPTITNSSAPTSAQEQTRPISVSQMKRAMEGSSSAVAPKAPSSEDEEKRAKKEAAERERQQREARRLEMEKNEREARARREAREKELAEQEKREAEEKIRKAKEKEEERAAKEEERQRIQAEKEQKDREEVERKRKEKAERERREQEAEQKAAAVVETSFVQSTHNTSDAPATVAPSVTGEELEAIYDFTSQGESQLTFTRGARFTIIRPPSAGWVWVTDKTTGQQGIVPESYCKRMTEVNSPPSSKTSITHSPIDNNQTSSPTATIEENVASVSAASSSSDAVSQDGPAPLSSARNSFTKPSASVPGSRSSLTIPSNATPLNSIAEDAPVNNNNCIQSATSTDSSHPSLNTATQPIVAENENSTNSTNSTNSSDLLKQFMMAGPPSKSGDTSKPRKALSSTELLTSLFAAPTSNTATQSVSFGHSTTKSIDTTTNSSTVSSSTATTPNNKSTGQWEGSHAVPTGLIYSSIPVVALFDFVASSPLQLSITKGDLLTVSYRDESGAWWEGVHSQNGGRGCVPASFIRPQTTSEEFSVQVLYTYNAADPQQLTIIAGETLGVFDTSRESWWLARRESDGYFGAIPANYVKKIETESNNAQPIHSLSVLYSATALFDFTAEFDGQLSFHAGQILEVLDKGDGDGWALARIHGTTNSGTVPIDFIKETAAVLHIPSSTNNTLPDSNNQSAPASVSAPHFSPPLLSANPSTRQSVSINNTPVQNPPPSLSIIANTPTAPTTPATTTVAPSSAAAPQSHHATNLYSGATKSPGMSIFTGAASGAPTPEKAAPAVGTAGTASVDLLRQFMVAGPRPSLAVPTTAKPNKTLSSAELLSALLTGGGSSNTTNATPDRRTRAPSTIETNMPANPAVRASISVAAPSALSASSAPINNNPLGTSTVLYDYPAQSSEQLSVKKGDLLIVINTTGDGNWATCQRIDGSAQGFVPVSYISAPTKDVAERTLSIISSPLPDPGVEYVSVYAYEAKNANELSLQVGQLFRATAGPEGWLMATNESGAKGLVPASYVTKVIGRLVALYDYKPDAAIRNALPFTKDSSILLTVTQDPNWWTGSCHGKYGIFPANYAAKI